MTVGGAYGRDYASLSAMKIDWEAGKDFIMLSIDAGFGPGGMGAYCSRRDFPGTEVWGRFKKNSSKGLLQKSSGT
jgi:selenocysteine lyase/cysteine desulfurase